MFVWKFNMWICDQFYKHKSTCHSCWWLHFSFICEIYWVSGDWNFVKVGNTPAYLPTKSWCQKNTEELMSKKYRRVVIAKIQVSHLSFSFKLDLICSNERGGFRGSWFFHRYFAFQVISMVINNVSTLLDEIAFESYNVTTTIALFSTRHVLKKLWSFISNLLNGACDPFLNILTPL